jgi:DNA-binding transcriptional MerR regulator
MTAPARPARDLRERSWSIRQLCREFDVTPRALRFYEDRGLLAPARRGATRVYSSRDRARLQLILRGKRVGFSLAEIGEMLALYDRQDGGAVQMAASLGKFRERVADLRRQRDDLDKAIVELEQGCAWIEERLSEMRPDLLPPEMQKVAADYQSVLAARLDAAE